MLNRSETFKHEQKTIKLFKIQLLSLNNFIVFKAATLFSFLLKKFTAKNFYFTGETNQRKNSLFT